MIPYRSDVKDRPKFFPNVLCKVRARIEQAAGKLKRFKRIAMRCEKTAVSFNTIVGFAYTLILIKSVHEPGPGLTDGCDLAHPQLHRMVGALCVSNPNRSVLDHSAGRSALAGRVRLHAGACR